MPNVDRRVVRVVFDHLRHTFGSKVEEALEDAGMSETDLGSRVAWISSAFLDRFYQGVAERQTGEPGFPPMAHPFWHVSRGAGRALVSDRTPSRG